jgi:hypothetical protein
MAGHTSTMVWETAPPARIHRHHLPLKKVDIFKGYAKFFSLNIPASFRLP